MIVQGQCNREKSQQGIREQQIKNVGLTQDIFKNRRSYEKDYPISTCRLDDGGV